MQGTRRHTVFIVGDSQVGETSITRRVFKNRDLIFVPSVNGGTEYQVSIQGGEFSTRILEIRNSAFLTENAIRFDAERDFAFFCYAIDDPESFQHVAERWIPLFKERVCDTMTMVLIGNKRDLRRKAEVIHNLAEQGLQPVSRNQGTEILHLDDAIDAFFESAINDFKALDQVTEIINDTILNYN
ncbi:hypothetical protein AVEN_87615-1 [Araneus ventricosus]|uniref:Uncharacterized protein n=1 Tax=Araneus ventricosus TaxID=182803 RepID=A0A4Y2R4G3_ARAVE|nr:hypothetical protein AVEN_87615-1 [Araneus ventricosus]